MGRGGGVVYDKFKILPMGTASRVVKTRDDELGCLSYIRIFCMVLCSSNVHITYGRDRAVGTATRYRVDGPEIESRWRRDLSFVYQFTIQKVKDQDI